MKQYLQFSIVLGLSFSSFFLAQAQVNSNPVTEQNVIKVTNVNLINANPNTVNTTVPDKNAAKIHFTSDKQDSPVYSGLQKTNPKESQSTTFLKKQDNSNTNQKYLRTPTAGSADNRLINDNTEAENINAPLYPDFKVTATKEEPYVNSFESKESKPEQLVSVKRTIAPEQAVDPVNAVTPTNPAQYTLSPLKRKYLEGVASELEKQIQADPNNTSIDMQARKKDLDDLKKLLAH